MNPTSRLVAIAAGYILLSPTGTFAATLLNGSLTGPSGEAIVPPGWQQYHFNTSDTADANGPFGFYNLSPDGGTFVRSFSWQRDTPAALYNQREGLEQTVGGLVIGQLYAVSFWQTSLNGINSITGEPFSGAPGQWSLALDGTPAATSALMSPPPGTSLDNVWNLQTLNFQAASTAQVLSLLATVPDAAPVNTRTFMGIDGVTLTAIPEPTAVSLLALGGFAASRLRRNPKF